MAGAAQEKAARGDRGDEHGKASCRPIGAGQPPDNGDEDEKARDKKHEARSFRVRETGEKAEHVAERDADERKKNESHFEIRPRRSPTPQMPRR